MQAGEAWRRAVLDATIGAMGVEGSRLHAWLGPAIGRRISSGR